ncbi:protein of unknown function [Shewanella benthica]|uniref:Uncharacterized protein n=1 Tax=Shewanella benthica TaxID=43661 RepID=A0A330LZ27_9GAMM|nr:protein of unknown function [Shewanella benthica]
MFLLLATYSLWLMDRSLRAYSGGSESSGQRGIPLTPKPSV